MADLAVTAAQVAPVFPNSPSTIIRVYTTKAAVTAGAAVYIDATAGTVDLASAADATKQPRGLSLATKAAGEPVRVLRRGEVYGFTLAGNYDTTVYQSDAAGKLADAHGTKTIPVGRIVPLNDGPTKTKVLDFNPGMVVDVS